jgi:hypothetical protein
MHGLHDKNAWLLLPEEHIINKYHETIKRIPGGLSVERQKFPSEPARFYYSEKFTRILHCI